MVAGKHKSGKRNDMSDAGLKVGDRVRYFMGATYNAPALVGRSGVVAGAKSAGSGPDDNVGVRWDHDCSDQMVFVKGVNLQRLPARAVAFCNVYKDGSIAGYADEANARAGRGSHCLNAAPIRIEYDLPAAAPRAPLKPGDRVKDGDDQEGNIIALDRGLAWLCYDDGFGDILDVSGLLPIDKNTAGT